MTPPAKELSAIQMHVDPPGQRFQPLQGVS